MTNDQNALLSDIRNGIENNQRQHISLTFELERTLRNLQVQKDEVWTVKDGSSTTTAVRPSVLAETFRYVVQGDNLRRETISGPLPDCVVTIYQGRQLETHQSIRQAWLFNEATTAHHAMPVDPRCLAFRSPLFRLTNWFDRVQIIDVRAVADTQFDGVVVNAASPAKTSLTVYFSRQRAFLPVRVEERLQDTSQLIFQSAVAYPQIPGTIAWFPASGTRKGWAYGDPSKAASSIDYRVLGRVQEQPDSPEELFDQKLPYEYVVLDTTGRSPAVEIGSQGQSMSGLFLRVPPPVRRNWRYVLAVDFLVLVSCLVFRSRLKF